MDEGNDRTTLPAADLESNIGDEPLGKKEFEGFNSRVDITVTSYRKRNHDPDGISAKAVLDGLVRRKILHDDSTKEVNSITFKSEISKEEKTVITLVEVDH